MIEKIYVILRQEAPLQTPFIIPFQDQRTGPAFFCVHSIGGEVTGYQALRKWMAPEVRFYGIQLPPEWRSSELATSVEAMASRYVEELLAFEPQGPYILGGWSAGSPVALEMAQQLEARGHRVSLLVAIDGPPFTRRAGLSPWNPLYAVRLVANLPRWIAERMSRDGMWADLRYRAGQKVMGRCRSIAARLRGDTALSKYTVRGYLGSQFEEKDIVFMEAFSDALDRYRAAPYSGRVLLYEARTQPLHHLLQTGAAWKTVAKRLEIVPVKGSHVSMIEEPHVRALAEHLSRVVLDLGRQAPVD
jgi:thioesterase domain-containing protein